MHDGPEAAEDEVEDGCRTEDSTSTMLLARAVDDVDGASALEEVVRDVVWATTAEDEVKLLESSVEDDSVEDETTALLVPR